MEVKKTLILDAGEPASKATSHLAEYPAVIITKEGRYYGIIDHRNITTGIRDPSSVRCETVIVRPPVLRGSAGVLERVDAFLLGHFKALPVVAENEKPLGITTRVELLDDIRRERLVPKESVSALMSAPVFTIDENETLARAKKMMNDRKVNRLVVTSKGYPVGVVSSLDMAAWAIGRSLPAGRKDRSREINASEMPISAFLRPDITSVEQNASLDDAIRRMIEKNVSAVIVTSGRRAMGVLSALDIFKRIQ
ncbi:MAG: CBS domain-containing protein, partial [Candidatus Aenigmatarchaeota archaeon]